jgi:hypothetical protein
MQSTERKSTNKVKSISNALSLVIGLVIGLVLVLVSVLVLWLGAELFSKILLGLVPVLATLLLWILGAHKILGTSLVLKPISIQGVSLTSRKVLWLVIGLVLGQILGLVLGAVLGLGPQKVAGLVVGLMAGMIAGLEIWLGLMLAAGLSSIVLRLLNIFSPFWLRHHLDMAIELEEAILRARGTREGLSLDYEIFCLRFEVLKAVLRMKLQKVLERLGFSI